MNNGKTHFKKGNNAAIAKTGRKHKSTLMREKLGINKIEVLKENVLDVWFELLNSKSLENRKFAVKEISKYIFPTKKFIEEKDGVVKYEDIIKRVIEKREARKNLQLKSEGENNGSVKK